MMWVFTNAEGVAAIRASPTPTKKQKPSSVELGLCFRSRRLSPPCSSGNALTSDHQLEAAQQVLQARAPLEQQVPSEPRAPSAELRVPSALLQAWVRAH